MFDIAIIGGGPAGSTLARLLSDRYSVLVIERRDLVSFEGASEKCCGGLISESAQKMLARMHLAVPKDVLVGPQIFTVRTIDTATDNQNYYPKHYVNIHRDRFDGWLLSLVPKNVEVRNGSFCSYAQDADGVSVKYISQGKEYTERCRYLIGADGAFSSIRRSLAGRERTADYIAIQEWFRCDAPMPSYSAIFDGAITDYYSWTIPKDDHLILGAAILPGKDAHAKFDLLKKKLSPYGFDFSRPEKRNGAGIIRPRSAKDIVHGKGRILCTGEAAGFISPSSAEGFSFAFRSAIALSDAFNDEANLLPTYRSNTASIRRDIFMKNLKSPVMFNSFLRNLAIKSGLSSLDMY